MKGILKIYHPEETLKYNIRSSYCKAAYLNSRHFLEVEIITDDALDHVEDDSLQYNFPQISLKISDYPMDDAELAGKTITIAETEEDTFTEADLFDDEEAYLYHNQISFSKDQDEELCAVWKGEIDDFYTGSDEPIPFKLKCSFRQEEIDVED